MTNTIAITKALYDTRKTTLTVEATSDYPNANLYLENFGPMTFTQLFKGKYIWSYVNTSVPGSPGTVTVSGPEGSVTVPVAIK
ncbi:hypothetical protein KQH41_00930 [bacterium]|jgi:hypothetical protein|nr:hypothetical protein [bacterium]BCA78269.1 hypothetical protein AOP6_0056 [Desulfuromonas sp. AOP6]